MAQIEYSTSSYKTPMHHRITASMPVEVLWTDADSGEVIRISGMTENVGESTALVNLEKLPPVGAEVRLKVLSEDKPIIEVATQVIRVERDPSKPLAALNVLQNLKKWKLVVMAAAEEWVTRHWHLNYDEEWVN